MLVFTKKIQSKSGLDNPTEPDFISQEMCTSRITGVTLPPFNMIPLLISSDNECHFENDDEVMVPCYNEIGEFEWPFPPRVFEHQQECIEICPDTLSKTKS